MSTLRMERTFAASPERVFAFLTKMENLLQWWGPEGTTITEHELDFSKTGPWSATMVGPQGHGAKVGGEVTALDPPHMVELTLSFLQPNGDPGDTSLIRFEVHGQSGGQTELRLTQSGLQAEHIPDMRDKGWASALDRLAHLINQT